jgi:hypothetical protein
MRVRVGEYPPGLLWEVGSISGWMGDQTWPGLRGEEYFGVGEVAIDGLRLQCSAVHCVVVAFCCPGCRLSLAGRCCMDHVRGLASDGSPDLLCKSAEGSGQGGEVPIVLVLSVFELCRAMNETLAM